MIVKHAEADICLILEGTYPYSLGGVASWTHELIRMHEDLTFTLVALTSANAPANLLYELPENVVGIKTIRLQRYEKGATSLAENVKSKLFASLKVSFLRLQKQAELNDLKEIIDALASYRPTLARGSLLDSPAAWQLLYDMYMATMPKTSFLDYFWSWRGLFGGMFDILLAELPQAKVYHALCTGYAGLLLARAHLETARPCIVTEHGIYTNERRIEISSAEWIDDPHSAVLGVEGHDRGIKDFWIDTFSNYSRFCYEASDHIITLYEGNQQFQLMDGAPPDRLRVIPNGIDAELYKRPVQPHPPGIALIGRVVPIKDIKAYISVVHKLKQRILDLRALMIGPADEDPDYAAECMDLVKYFQLENTLTFTGKSKIQEYFGQIDVLVLTSLSEAQPLVILEAGAAGIPVVATDVGSCRELIMGAKNENPKLGPGGAVVPLGNPTAVADALYRLLSDHQYYDACSRAIAERVRRYYSKADQKEFYASLYHELMSVHSSVVQKRAQA